MRIYDILTSPWAIHPDKYQEICSIYETHLRGEKIDLAGVEQRLGRPLANEQRTYEIVDGVAVLPVEGVIAKRMGMFTRISGGASTQFLEQQFRQALADPGAHSILLQVDSPGGAASGIQELATLIAGARGAKPVAAWTDGLMASAAYWLSSAVDQIYISGDTTMVGSIGVVTKHVDVSKAEERLGVKTTEIYAGKYKTLGSMYQPLDDDARAELQRMVDAIYGIFVDAVAANRGVDSQTVLDKMAEGRIFLGRDAIDAGLVDGVATLDQVIADLGAGRITPRSSSRMQAGVASAQKPTATQETDMSGITKDFILANHPDIAEAFRAEGRIEGADAERARIKDVEAQLLPGHTKLITELKFDGKTTGPQAAVAVLNAERAMAEARQQQNINDAPKPVASAPAPDADADAAAAAAQAAADAKLSPEERAKKRWETDAKIRDEFATCESYVAYEKANAAGKVRVLGKK